ncbi:MAG: tetratricopeptide repeat protein [Firmicutes bacterium]|nr:tetratricopeptide repeat protein [Bacillota bacterium]
MNKKTWIILLAVVLFIIAGAAVPALAAPISVVVDGTALTLEVDPVIENDRTLVPLRAIFQALGASVDWDGSTRTVTAFKGPDKVSLTIGSSTAYQNDEPFALDAAPIIKDGHTLVPLRFVSEAMGAAVQWDAGTQTATISSPGFPGSAWNPDQPTVSGPENDPEYYYELAAREFQAGDYYHALQHLDQAIGKGFNDSLAFFQRGYIYAKTGEYQLAIDDYSKAIALTPASYPYFYNYRGNAYREMGQPGPAADDYRRALSLGYIPGRVEYKNSQEIKSGALVGVELYQSRSIPAEDVQFSTIEYGLPRLADGFNPPFKKDWVYYDKNTNSVFVGYFMEGALFDAYARGGFDLEEIFIEGVNAVKLTHPGARVYGWVQLEELIQDPKNPPPHGVDATYRPVENGWLMEFTINYFGEDTDGCLSICREAVG